MVPRGQIRPAVGNNLGSNVGNNDESLERLNACKESVRIFVHGHGGRALRLGLTPDLRPVHAIHQLQQLMNGNAFWAGGRTLSQLRRMIRNSTVCVTAWRGNTLVGFGRATSDGIYRATIWDLVVDSKITGRGVGRAIVERLTESRALAPCERIYLMTTNSAGFYKKMGFQINPSQVLMVKQKSG